MTTLSDMAPEERAQCRGMWCEDEDGFLCVYKGDHLGRDWLSVCAYPEDVHESYKAHEYLTPRPDLPRAWTPEGQPPAGEWEHAEYLGDYKGMTDVYHFDGEPTHRRWVGSWEEA